MTPHSHATPHSRTSARRIPEVLAPAGNLRGLKTAVDFNADAVYCGGKAFGMRSAPKNFSLEDFEEGAAYAHARGARVYVTCNILPRNDEIQAMREYIGQLKDTGIDALIVTDIGVLMMAHQIAPNLELHISTQAGVTNYGAAQSLYELGARRVVLARELDLQAVRDIRANIPEDMDIECFVHGSMCMAFSGRCLISQYMTGRDANHGECTQPCRWKYSLVEEKRPGQVFPVEETTDGTFLFNSQDMCMIDHIDDLIDAGASSLKIEGRAKSAYYVAAMANAYKMAVNEYMIQRGFEDADGNVLQPFHHQVVAAGEIANTDTETHESWGHAQVKPQPHVVLPDWVREEPYKVAHREYSTGFYYPENQVTQHTESSSYIRDWLVVGEVLSWEAPTANSNQAHGRLTIMSRNKIIPGQQIEVLLPGQAPLSFELPSDGILDADGNPVDVIRHPARVYSFPFPHELPVNAMLRSPMPARQT